MTDRPIIFSAPMVLALLREVEAPGAGKTMTRRLAWRDAEFGLKDYSSEQLEDMDVKGWNVVGEGNDGMFRVYKPTPWQRVKPGDRLWVRETWQEIADGHNKVRVRCAADNEYPAGTIKWRSPIHMPRWASRLTLVVTATKIERLQDISREDAIAEGLKLASQEIEQFFRWPPPYDAGMWLTTPAAFAWLWRQLHGPDSWDANPEVVALTFRPIAALPQEQAA